MKKKEMARRAAMPGAMALANTLNRLGPPPVGGLMAGMQGLGQGGQQMQGLTAYMRPLATTPDRFHYKCPECSRLFINNISCPRCGWGLPR